MQWRNDIIGIIEALRPTDVLAVMPAHEPLWRELARRTRDMDCRRISGVDVLTQAFKRGRSQLAIAAGTLEHMNKRDAGAVIARLRDLYSNVLYAALPIGDRWPGLISRWNNSELIAYGLRPARQYTVGGKPFYLYHYDIYDYKLTPDWLNSKHWANPHRWDKERW
jgi:hypothetical protein